ncbi:hypothetical protein CANCADRAFT_30835 [Tortispora caseinolytica NRRL Y-17796]|uniref:Myb-like domain-containing protein n=1 Tax=Tortispora caseinolytica NRRL Y-17796 TaxID=767744 RepID=A0A1E4TMB1_9ASCO|nr:hypothetical protein CANCADRAFT_30835 [Tortispora caseinolytica NRRL Y-17796]
MRDSDSDHTVMKPELHSSFADTQITPEPSSMSSYHRQHVPILPRGNREDSSRGTPASKTKRMALSKDPANSSHTFFSGLLMQVPNTPSTGAFRNDDHYSSRVTSSNHASESVIPSNGELYTPGSCQSVLRFANNTTHTQEYDPVDQVANINPDILGKLSLPNTPLDDHSHIYNAGADKVPNSAFTPYHNFIQQPTPDTARPQLQSSEFNSSRQVFYNIHQPNSGSESVDIPIHDLRNVEFPHSDFFSMGESNPQMSMPDTPTACSQPKHGARRYHSFSSYPPPTQMQHSTSSNNSPASTVITSPVSLSPTGAAPLSSQDTVSLPPSRNGSTTQLSRSPPRLKSLQASAGRVSDSKKAAKRKRADPKSDSDSSANVKRSGIPFSKYTIEQDAVILRMRLEGSSWADIAAELNMQNPNSARNRFQVLIGQQGQVAMKWGKNDESLLKRLLIDGERAKWIHIAIHLSKKTNKSFSPIACQKKFKELFEATQEERRLEELFFLNALDSASSMDPQSTFATADIRSDNSPYDSNLSASASGSDTGFSGPSHKAELPSQLPSVKEEDSDIRFTQRESLSARSVSGSAPNSSKIGILNSRSTTWGSTDVPDSVSPVGSLSGQTGPSPMLESLSPFPHTPSASTGLLGTIDQDERFLQRDPDWGTSMNRSLSALQLFKEIDGSTHLPESQLDEHLISAHDDPTAANTPEIFAYIE